MNRNKSEEFYIGYLPAAPRDLAALIRKMIFLLLGLAILISLLLVFGLHKLPLSNFEFGRYRDFEGIVQAKPYPVLLVRKENSVTQYWLVAEGKHGADVNNFDGKKIKLKGSLIYRDGIAMIEVAKNSIAEIASSESENLLSQNLGTFTLTGEIVDSKCYAGVMNPGHTKPHRECAALCIGGGIPPLFIAYDQEGNETALQLVSADGEPVNQQVLDLVAEPVKITGEILRKGDHLIFQADPRTYQRIN